MLPSESRWTNGALSSARQASPKRGVHAMATSGNLLQMATDITKAAIEQSGNFSFQNEDTPKAVANFLEVITKKLKELSQA